MTTEPLNEYTLTRQRRPYPAWLVFWLFLSFALAIVGIAAAVFDHYQDNQINQQLETMITVPQTSVVEIQQLLTNNQEQLATQQDQLTTLQKTVSVLQTKINDHTPVDLQWIKDHSTLLHQQAIALQTLSSVMHLQLAQQLLLAQHDKNTIIVELSQAIDSLELTGTNPAYVQALTKVAQQVTQLPTIDSTAVLNGLQELDNQLSTLQFESPAQNATPVPINLSWWQRSIDKLKSLVVIHDNNALSQQLLTQADRLNAIRTIKMWISAASSSAWQGNQAQYQLAMDQVTSTVLQFTQMTPAQVAWLEQAQHLSTLAVGYPPAAVKRCLQPLQTVTNALQTPVKPATGVH